jgi:hypothetical protein
MNTQIESECPFTAEQFKALTESQRQAIEAVAEYLTGATITARFNDEEITGTCLKHAKAVSRAKKPAKTCSAPSVTSLARCIRSAWNWRKMS